jgi:hypothetical protein
MMFGRKNLGAKEKPNKLSLALPFSDPDIGVYFLKANSKQNRVLCALLHMPW